jgi:hypothetical protein
MFRWRWDREEDEQESRGLTRRTFLRLSGLAGLFAVTAPVHGLAIAERGPIEVVTEAMFLGRDPLPFDFGVIDGILKDVYAPLVIEQVNRRSVFQDLADYEQQHSKGVKCTASSAKARVTLT